MNGTVVGALLVVAVLLIWFYGRPLLDRLRAWLETWRPR